MFTGIVHGCGTVRAFIRRGKMHHLAVSLPKKFPSVKIGGSVAVDGACLTVVRREKGVLFFDVVAETVRKTGFSAFAEGTRVHLEPALKYNHRIEGHFVQGHVDGVGVVRKIVRQKSDLALQLTFPAKLKHYIFSKGSVAVDGVSLTIGDVSGNRFWLYLIPHTLGRTHFVDLHVGSRVNLEADVLVKFFKTLNTSH